MITYPLPFLILHFLLENSTKGVERVSTQYDRFVREQAMICKKPLFLQYKRVGNLAYPIHLIPAMIRAFSSVLAKVVVELMAHTRSSSA